MIWGKATHRSGVLPVHRPGQQTLQSPEGGCDVDVGATSQEKGRHPGR